jgi:hypothetical protein
MSSEMREAAGIWLCKGVPRVLEPKCYGEE